LKLIVDALGLKDFENQQQHLDKNISLLKHLLQLNIVCRNCLSDEDGKGNMFTNKTFGAIPLVVLRK